MLVLSEIEQKKIVKGVNDVHKLCCFGGVCVRINDKHQTEIEGQTDTHTHTHKEKERRREAYGWTHKERYYLALQTNRRIR